MRKRIKYNEAQSEELQSNGIELKAGAYLRISQAEPGQEAESVDNQRRIIEDYVRRHPDMEVKAFYRDIGVSGRSFERDAFQKLLADIDSGQINCVIVKDLSRLGRNLIETGYYIENYFSRRGVRLISVNDHVETADGIINLDPHGPKSIPLINLMNESVSNEISRSTKSVLTTYAAEGKYIAPRAPFGYMKDPTDCHKLLIDAEAAAIVRMIFNKAAQGVSITGIARELNQSGIIPPSVYARQHGLQGNYQDSDGGWNTRTLKKMLTNRTYTGMLVQGEKQIAVRGTHEPIVTQELFDQVQRNLCPAKRELPSVPTEAPAVHPLRGKVICCKCGAKMQRKRGSGNADWYYYTCITKNRQGEVACSGEYIREDAVFSAIKSSLSEMLPEHIEKRRQCERQKRSLEMELRSLQAEQSIVMAKRRAEYERYVFGKVTRNEYFEVINTFPTLEQPIEHTTREMEQINFMLSYYSSLIDATYSRAALEAVMKTIVQEVTVSDGKVCDVVLKSVD